MSSSEQQRATGKRGPRKKTGCLTCRARHTRCDEQLPTCSACIRADLRCERTGPIVFQPHGVRKKQSPTSSAARPSLRAKDSINASAVGDAYLLRRFQDGIAVWIDLFDHQQRYQRMLMRRVPHSELLRHAICALSARQLSLQQSSTGWDTAASEHYSAALRLQGEAMKASAMSELLLPATLLLASYELMLLPGPDYSQHLLGAKAILEAQYATLQRNPLWLAAYWHFFRHDVSVALSADRPLLLDQFFWLDQAFDSGIEEDDMGNASLVLIARALMLAHGATNRTKDPAACFQLREDLAAWNVASSEGFSILEADDDRLAWYAIPAAAPAKQQALIAGLLLRRAERGKHSSREDSDHDLGEQIISISRSEVSDAAQVQAVHYMCYAIRTIEALPSRQHAVDIMRDLETRTGFHTASRIPAVG